MSISKVRYKAILYSPDIIAHWLSKQSAALMIRHIKELDISSGSVYDVQGVEMRKITFQHKTQLIGHKADQIEQKIFGYAAKALQLDPTFAKVLLDAVARYTYPHMGGAVLKMDSKVNERNMFHPQHHNFLLEEESISQEDRIKISEHFTPQPSWHCLDIGGFLGHGALWLRQQIDSSGKIICVEANEHNRCVLDEQMRINDFNNIHSKFAAIWHTAGERITFNLTKRQGNAIDNNVVNGTKTKDIPTVSIQSLTEELGRAADFVSLTVNGAEVEAIEGMKKMNPQELPKRILAPGWYAKGDLVRMDLIENLYRELGYNYVVTKGLMSFAWLKDL